MPDNQLASEREYPSFYVHARAVANASNKSMLSILNTEATWKFTIREIWIINVQTAAVTGAPITYETRRITGHSGGTSITTTPSANGEITTMDTADSLPAGVTARTNATVSGEDGADILRRLFSTDDWGSGTLDQEGYEHMVQQAHPIYRAHPPVKPLTIRTNEGVHIRQNGTVTTGTFDIVVCMTQEPL